MLNPIFISSSDLNRMVRRNLRRSRLVLKFCVVPLVIHAAMAQTFLINPRNLSFTAAADSTTLPPAQTLQVTSGAGNVPFVVLIERVDLVGKIPPFVAVNPSSGTTPATVAVNLVPGVTQYFGPTTRNVTLDFYKSGPNNTITLPYTSVTVSFTITPPPLPPTIASIVNAATLQPGISPGGIFTIFGAHLAYLDRGVPKNSFYDTEDYYFPSAIGGSVVSFNGRASPMLYSDPGQIGRASCRERV